MKKKLDLSVENISLDIKIVLPLFVVFLMLLLGGGTLEVAKIIFLLSAGVMGVFLWIKRKNLKTSGEFRVKFCLWVAYLAAHVLAMVDGASLALSVPKTIEMMGVFVWFNYFYFNFEKKHASLLVWFLLFSGVILSLISFYFIICPPPPGFPSLSLVYASFGHNHLSDYLLLILPLVVVLWVVEKKKKEQKRWFWLLVFFLLSFFLTFARGAYLVWSLILVLILWIYKPSLKKILFLGGIALVPLILLLGIMVFSHSQRANEILFNGENKINWLWRQTIKPLNNEGRIEYWKQALKGWELRPWLGNGPGTFRLTSKRFQTKPESWSWFAHSSLLQSLSELGMVGGGLFVSLMLYSLYAAGRQRSFILKGLWIGLVASFGHSLVDFDFSFLGLLVLFWIIVSTISIKESGVLWGKKASFCLLVTNCVVIVFVIFWKANQMQLVPRYNQMQLLYKEDPSWFFDKAENGSGENWSLSKSYYKKSLELDPLNIAYLTNYFDFLLEKEDYESIGWILKILGENIYPKGLTNSLFGEIDWSSELLVDAYTADLSDFLSAGDNKRLAVAKIYYFLGLSIIEEDVGLTRNFWLLARDIYPEGGYFHAELAGLEKYKFGNTNKALTIIVDCRQNKSAWPHCKKIEEDIERQLPPPGEIKRLIEEAY